MSSILSEYVREQAYWREEKAEEYPDDQRNAQSAAALNSLADYLETEDGEANRSATYINQLGGPDELLALGEESKRLVGRYGFGYPASSIAQHEAFLDELSVEVMKDIYAYAAEHGEDWSDTLIAAEVEAARNGVHLPQRYWEGRSHKAEFELEEAVESYAVDAAVRKFGEDLDPEQERARERRVDWLVEHSSYNRAFAETIVIGVEAKAASGESIDTLLKRLLGSE